MIKEQTDRRIEEEQTGRTDRKNRQEEQTGKTDRKNRQEKQMEEQIKDERV
ncbi:MAG: hypothetical protein BWY80_00272 [Firmicutes bacterium ADurb.Bin456]|nr:MAG: hypothetical protein BWY80_00272 [Firmicutes bacterium ADurb.Bin456]